MSFKVGDTVEIIDVTGISMTHPTEPRPIKNGDILVVKRVGPGYVYLYEEGSVGLLACRFRKVEQPTEAVIEKECTCPDLLNGHHPGCPYLA